MRPRILLTAAVLVVAGVCLTLAGAPGAAGRLELYLVNSGPQSAFYNESHSTDGNCLTFQKSSSLSTQRGTSGQFDSPGYAFEPEFAPSSFSYTVTAGFTVPAQANAVILKLWSYSGDGTCRGQTDDQIIDWRVLCSGTCGSNTSLTGPGQGDPKAGWQAFDLPAGTPTSKLFNDQAGPSSAVKVHPGDVITLEISADTWAGIHWSAPHTPGASSVSLLKR